MSNELTLRGYLPESELLKNKQMPPMRLCREHLAVVEPAAAYRILASRGIGLPTGADFRTATKMTEEECNALAEAKDRTTMSLLAVGARPLLVLTDWMSELGLLLLIIPECKPTAAYTAMTALCPEATLPEKPTKRCKATEAREAHELLSEIFSYTDVLKQRRFDRLGITDPIRRLIAFAGYRLDVETVRAISNRISDSLRSQKALAFLFCAHLALRDRMGVLQIEGELPSCRISFSEAAYPPKIADDIPPFARAACFSDCIVLKGAGKTLELCFTPSLSAPLASTLSAPTGYLIIRIEQL